MTDEYAREPRVAPPVQSRPAKGKSPIAWVLGGLALAVGKLKLLLVGLKLASFGKLALTSLTMLTSIWFYSQIYGLSFAVGFVVLILVHELGHGAAMKLTGVQAGWPIFIPFFGASIALKSMPRSDHDHAVIAYGGPLAGTAASLGCAAIGLLTHERYWFALAYTGCFLNLFNMIPVVPLDGGRIASGFSPRSWVIGAVLLGGMFFVTHAPQLLLIAALALMSGLRRRGAPATMTPMSDSEKATWTRRYFGLCFALGAALYFTHRLQESTG